MRVKKQGSQWDPSVKGQGRREYFICELRNMDRNLEKLKAERATVSKISSWMYSMLHPFRGQNKLKTEHLLSAQCTRNLWAAFIIQKGQKFKLNKSPFSLSIGFGKSIMEEQYCRPWEGSCYPLIIPSLLNFSGFLHLLLFSHDYWSKALTELSLPKGILITRWTKTKDNVKAYQILVHTSTCIRIMMLKGKKK